MSLADLEASVRRRVDSAWRDPELTQKDVRSRFGLSDDDTRKLVRELGPKARLGAVSRWAINSQRKKLKLRRLAGAR